MAKTKMTQEEFDAWIETTKQGVIEDNESMGYDCEDSSIMYDIADSVLVGEPRVAEFISEMLGTKSKDRIRECLAEMLAP